MTRIITALIPLLLVLLSVPCSSAEKFEYNRIVSLSPLLTEEIFLLERNASLIADTVYCIHPEAAKKKAKIGNLIDFSVEKIYSLEPDLILASGLTDPKKLEKFRQLKIRVEMFLQPADFRDICSQYVRLGKLLNREEKAKKAVKTAQEKVQTIIRKSSLTNPKKVFIEIGNNPLFTAGRDSFINDFIVMAGGTNITADAGSGMISLETVLNRNPDVIIISDMGTSPDTEKKFWSKYQSLKAVQNGAVYTIDAYDLCSPTPVSFVSTLRKITEMIHPELKNRLQP